MSQSKMKANMKLTNLPAARKKNKVFPHQSSKCDNKTCQDIRLHSNDNKTFAF